MGERTAIGGTSKGSRTGPGLIPRVWLIVLAVAACGLFIGIYAVLSLDRFARTSEATRVTGNWRDAATASRAGTGRTEGPAFSTQQAMRVLYGNYDPNLDGAFWTITGAPKSYAQWNGRAVFLRPLISRTFDQRGLTRHILVTNTLDVKDGSVVKQGAGCRTCPSLVGASVFEKDARGWTLISRHDFLTADGAWGAPPKVSLLVSEGGGIELRFDRPAIDARNPGRQYSIALKDREPAASEPDRR